MRQYGFRLRTACWLLAACLLCAPLSALATDTAAPRVESVSTQIGENSVSYPQLDGLSDAAVQRKINEDIVLSADITSHLLTLGRLTEGGFGLTVRYQAFLNDRLLSVVVVAAGQGENGRYMQRNTALTYRLSNGERVTAEQVFADVPAAAAALELELDETLAQELSAYLENSQLSPLPTENLYLDADGVTFYYPYEQFSLFSGYAGAAQFAWEELRPYLRSGAEDAPALAGFAAREEAAVATLREALAQGRMPRVPVALGDSLSEVIERFRLLRDPDFFPGGKLYQLEAPAFRGVLLLSDGITSGWEHSVVQGVRTLRFDQCGVRVGETAQAEWRRILGPPDSTVRYDENTAYDYAVVPGECDYYAMGAYTLQLFGNADGVLYAVQLTQ